MINFDKELPDEQGDKPLHPEEIYDSLDRKSDVGPLRPAQQAVLRAWYDGHRDQKDVIVKLHTGEGKTLIGLLMLQSRINSHGESGLYLCPNRQLIQQVKRDARKFGIAICEIVGRDIPEDFTEGRKILVTTVQRLFNGRTIFQKGTRSIKVENIVADDSHACIDAIKDSFTIRIRRRSNKELYDRIREMFSDELQNQGAGTALRITQGNADALLPVAYWVWKDRYKDVLELLAENCESDNSIKFPFPLIENSLEQCQCFISGTEVEISPYHFPLSKFKSFDKARQRILMSATTQDDSFFIKGLGVSVESVKSPITSAEPKWSGEKMILIPSLIDSTADSNAVIKWFSGIKNKTFGRVALVSSFDKASVYEAYESKVASDDIEEIIQALKDGDYGTSVVLVNRYDGIDLPDDNCRLMVIDGLPYFNSLVDRYEESCRTDTDTINIRLAQRIEQGLGRGVRGEKDYCCIVLIGNDLIKFVKSNATNKYFSAQTRQQINIGLKIAEISKTHDDEAPTFKVVVGLVSQVLQRESSWKSYYTRSMNEAVIASKGFSLYEQLEAERDAEHLAFTGRNDKAYQVISNLCNKLDMDEVERGWYYQMMARFKLSSSGVDSNKMQLDAYNLNQDLLKPREGVVYKQLSGIAANRIDAIREYLHSQASYGELMLTIEDVLSHLSFGTPAAKFEKAFEQIGNAIGFGAQRPDARYKVGPDVLWFCEGKEYILFECKSEVKRDRANIVKQETGQMSNHINWFVDTYQGARMTAIMVHPTNRVSGQANFDGGVQIMMEKGLNSFRESVRSFFKEFKSFDITTVGDQRIQEWIVHHKLKLKDITSVYTVLPIKTGQSE